MMTKQLSRSAQRALTAASLQRELTRRAIWPLLTEGPGALLFFMWAIGAIALTGIVGTPVLVVPLSIAATVIGALMLRDYVHDPAVLAKLLPGIVRTLVPAPAASNRAMQRLLEQGQQLLAEIGLKVIEATRDEHDHSRVVLIGQAGALVVLQHDVARQATEFARVLEIVGRAETRPGPLLDANTAALRREAEKADAFVAEIVEQLQTLLLQVTQLGVRAVDVVRAAEFTRQGRESLEQIQAEVSTRQAVAEQLTAELAAPTQAGWLSVGP